MKALKMVAIFIVLGIMAAGCASNPAVTTTGTPTTTEKWDEAATKAYKITGLTIQTAQALLPVAQPYLSEGGYSTYSTLINTTVPAVYDTVGAALEAVIGVTDAAKRADAMTTYETALAKLTPLMLEVAKTVSVIQAAQSGATK